MYIGDKYSSKYPRAQLAVERTIDLLCVDMHIFTLSLHSFRHTKDVSELIKLYNELIMSMNKQFVYWDKCLNEYESRHNMF